ncbi:MAG TPA: hypothetical protein VG123_32175 [Streptosporangiaceae bacterium]|nr:hypothetical protein [Streptosporangiaceae bacterium]
MVMLDRRKLAAPLFAQAAAFVAVLVIGGFTGHASTAGPAHGTTPSASASSSTSTRASASKGPAHKLTVKVVEESTDGLSVSGSQVNVLENGTLTSVVSGALNSALEFAANVPAGRYQVCVDPPIGWASAVRTTHVLAGWICSAADVKTGPLLVTFRLTPQLPQVGQ